MGGEQKMGQGMSGGNSGWTVAMMVFGVVVLGVAIWAAVALSRRGDGGLKAFERDSRLLRGGLDPDEDALSSSEPTAREILDARLARGEIDPEAHRAIAVRLAHTTGR